MATMFSLLLLFLICLSMHACNARHLGVIDKDTSTQVGLSSKEVEKARFYKTSEELRQQQESTNGESMIDESQGGVNTQERKDSKSTLLKGDDEKEGTTQSKDLDSISWHVPHDKHTEDPGFSLDYSPPKTHPPTHN